MKNGAFKIFFLFNLGNEIGSGDVNKITGTK